MHILLALGVAAAALSSDSPTAAGVSDAWTQDAFHHIEALEYHVSVSTHGVQAPNRAQDLRTSFRPGGIEVVARRGGESPPWRFQWRTTRWGRRGHWTPVEASSPVADGPRVDYRSPGLCEWYVNRPSGIEQGFTARRRPAGDGPLRIEGAIGTGLQARLVADAIELDAPGDVPVLRIDALHVWDATGRDLAAWFELCGAETEAETQAAAGAATAPAARLASTGGDRVAIVVDDGGAAYPLTIDPVLTSPSWITTGTATDDNYGWSVDTAGDVDGDGYSDVVVGAPRYDGGLIDQGAVFLYHGSAAGLSATPAWTGLGGQELAQYGWDVQTAGDVDGDGFDDVIVGAIYYEATLPQQGRAVLYHGSAAGLSTSPAWTVDGEVAKAEFGNAVGTAGDVNGDGFDDVMVGSQGFEDGEAHEGRAYLFEGSAAGLSTSPAWTVDGNQADAVLGYRVGTAGDVNADGYDDVMVSADRYDGGQTNEGKVFVYHGSPTGPGVTADWTAEGNQTDAFFGIGAGTAGDVNGDGYADLIVGAPYFDDGDQGKAFIYTGSPLGLGSTPFWTTLGHLVDSNLGFAVGTAGDVNGDGFADVIVGAPGYANDRGIARLWRGSASTMVEDSFDNRNDAGSRFGQAVATAGDVDGDGFSDLIIGAWQANEGGTELGAAFLYRGSPATVSETVAWTAESNQEEARFGYSVSGCGDVNGDGYSDVIVGVPLFDVGASINAGAAFAYLGTPNGLTAFPVWTRNGAVAGDLFGYDVSGVGDVNGDGFDDVVVGAPHHELGNGTDGAAFVYQGSAAGLAENPAWSESAETQPGLFGSAVSGAGDVNGDGLADVVIGAPTHSNGENDEGAAYVYLGNEAGLETTPAWSTESNQTDARLGIAVSSAGDVDADGYADVLVGASGFSAGQDREGAAFVYHGSPAGPAVFPGWSAEGDQASAGFGASVSTAGDVDGDGFSDVVVGAPNYSGAQTSEGRAYLFLGSPAGLGSFSSWTVEGNQDFANLGHAVSTAGDVNGDGYSDVIVSVHQIDTPLQNAGRVYVYHGSPAGLATTVNRYFEGQQAGASLGAAVASAGDVNGDGFADILYGETGFSGGQPAEGVARCHHGNGGDGRQRLPRQLRTDGSTPIALGGLSDSPSSCVVTAMGRSPEGRAEVWMEVEVKPAGIPFDGAGTLMTDRLDTGIGGVALEQLVSDLQPDGAYHWRLRTVSDSPFFPRSPWFSPPGNAATELDLRTPGGASSVDTVTEAPGSVASKIQLAPARPNPFRTSTTLAFEIGRAGHGRVGIYDVMGRRVAVLADRRFEAGRHRVTWDGRTASGSEAAQGIYFARVTFDDTIETRTIVLVR